MLFGKLKTNYTLFIDNKQVDLMKLMKNVIIQCNFETMGKFVNLQY